MEEEVSIIPVYCEKHKECDYKCGKIYLNGLFEGKVCNTEEQCSKETVLIDGQDHLVLCDYYVDPEDPNYEDPNAPEPYEPPYTIGIFDLIMGNLPKPPA